MKKRWVLVPLIAAAVLGSWVVLHGNDGHAQTAADSAAPEVTVAEALSRAVSESRVLPRTTPASHTIGPPADASKTA